MSIRSSPPKRSNPSPSADFNALAEKIDSEIGSLLRTAQQTAIKVLDVNRARLTFLANRLLVEETMEGPELKAILNGSALFAGLRLDLSAVKSANHIPY